MGILDGSFDPTSPDGGASLGWLGLVLGAPLGAPQPLGWPDQAFANPVPTTAGPPFPQAADESGSGNPFSALFAGARHAARPWVPPLPANAPSASPSRGLGDRINAGLMNFANSRGLLPAIAGGITGLSTGRRTDPAGIVQQHTLDAYHALLGMGLSPAAAQAAALNPAIIRAIAPTLFGRVQKPGGQSDASSGVSGAGVPRSLAGTNAAPMPPGRNPARPPLGASWPPRRLEQPSADFWKA